MTINYTTLLGLAKPVTGTEANAWGDVVNDQITSLVEDAIANAVSISVAAGNVTLSDNDGSTDQSRMAILLITGSPGTTRNIVAPSRSKWYIVRNGSDSSVVVKGSATTGVTIAAGKTALVFWNGSDFALGSTTEITQLSGTLAVANGGTGITSFGTGVATALGQNVTGSGGIVLATSPTLSTPNLGTPSAATLTNATGLPIDGGTTGTLPVNRGGTGVTSSTGSGSVVLSASPALSGSPTAPTQASSTNNTTIATTAFVQAALQALHPIGSIYINATNATNPGSLLGFGTWVAFGAGRVPVGFNASNPLFDSAEETGGSADAIVVSHTHSFSATSSGQSATHTHSGTTDSAGTHTHTANFGNSTGGNNFFFEGRINQVGNITDGINSAGAHTHTFTTGNASGDHTHSVSGTTGSTGSSATNTN